MLRLRAAVSHGSPCFSSLPSLLRALEILASVCWCDDEAREAVGAAGGVAVVAAVMKLYCQHAAVQAGACMVLMALVRGEGEVCLANQWHIAKVRDPLQNPFFTRRCACTTSSVLCELRLQTCPTTIL